MLWDILILQLKIAQENHQKEQIIEKNNKFFCNFIVRARDFFSFHLH